MLGSWLHSLLLVLLLLPLQQVPFALLPFLCSLASGDTQGCILVLR
jgi:hypothetical protein